jgi:hypothetical protein
MPWGARDFNLAWSLLGRHMFDGSLNQVISLLREGKEVRQANLEPTTGIQNFCHLLLLRLTTSEPEDFHCIILSKFFSLHWSQGQDLM